MRKEILVTGGAGFVGSYLVEELVRRNCSVTVIDNFSTGRFNNLKSVSSSDNFDWLHKDIRKVCLGVGKFDAVFHLAAKPFSKAKEDWFSESRSIFQTNVEGTYNILRQTNPNCHFIFTSSAAVYGEGRDLSETLPYNPCSAYGYSKTLAEQVIIHSPRKYTILRPGTIIGPRGRCFPNRVMWSIVKGEKCTFFDNGNVFRDIISVHDVVSAMIEVMNQKTFGVFNLGANTTITGLKLSEKAEEIAIKNKLKLKKQFTQFVPKDFVKVSTLNSNKLYHKLNWTPKYSLRESLKEIFDYYCYNSEAMEPPSWDSL